MQSKEVTNENINDVEYKQLLELCKKEYADVPACLLEHIIKDYLCRPEHYDKIYKGELQIGPAKVRDTQDDINLLSKCKDECEIGENLVSVVGEHC